MLSVHPVHPVYLVHPVHFVHPVYTSDVALAVPLSFWSFGSVMYFDAQLEPMVYYKCYYFSVLFLIFREEPCQSGDIKNM